MRKNIKTKKRQLLDPSQVKVKNLWAFHNLPQNYIAKRKWYYIKIGLVFNIFSILCNLKPAKIQQNTSK